MCPTSYKIQMETSTPGNKRLHNISEVSCPDSCNQPEQEKGCHFRMGPDRFTCTKCQLRIWRHFMGCELTPTDLQEMLHGEKVTSSEKTLTWKKDGNETTIRGRLLLNEGYKVRIAPKLKSKQITDEACPKCKTGKLQLITAIDDSKWYGCDGYPQCRFTKAFIPHTFKPALLDNRPGGAKSGKGASGTKGAQNGDSGSGHSQSATLRIKKPPTLEKQPTEPENAEAPADDGMDSVARPEVLAEAPLATRRETSAHGKTAPEPAFAEVSDPNGRQSMGRDVYQRIPKFILKMLKLVEQPTVKRPDAPSVSN